MRVSDLDWMQLESLLDHDDRIVLPLGSTEQHAYLSLATDSILAERVAVEAAQPLGVPVLPVLAYGLAHAFAAYPGTLSVAFETYVAVLSELVESLRGQGFRRILLVNGHGGNSPAADRVAGADVVWHDWWRAPATWAAVQAVDPEASHASWMENFPWTRLPGVTLPTEPKAMVDWDAIGALDPVEIRRALGDGSFGGRYERPDEDVLGVWKAGVEETRAVLESGWTSPTRG